MKKLSKKKIFSMVGVIVAITGYFIANGYLSSVNLLLIYPYARNVLKIYEKSEKMEITLSINQNRREIELFEEILREENPNNRFPIDFIKEVIISSKNNITYALLSKGIEVKPKRKITAITVVNEQMEYNVGNYTEFIKRRYVEKSNKIIGGVAFAMGICLSIIMIFI